MSAALRIRVLDVQRAAARVFGLPVATLTGPVILRSVTWPRHVAIAVAEELTDRTWEEIAHRFNRDATTVRYAIYAVRARRDRAAIESVERVRIEARHEAQRFRDEMRSIAADAEAEARERAMLATLPAANSGRAA